MKAVKGPAKGFKLKGVDI